MFRKIVSTVFSLLYLSLWARLFLMMWDPFWSGTALDRGLPLYHDWRFVLDWLYYLTSIPMTPIWTIYGWIAPSIPKTPYLPGFYTVSLFQGLEQKSVELSGSMPWLRQLVDTPFFRQVMIGYVDTLIPVAMIIYRLIEPLPNLLFNFIRNIVWTIFIELSFTKRKEATYKTALSKRAADLMKLNVEYKTLSNENSQLAVSVVTDELTKVYNKRFFIEKMTYEFKLAKEKKKIIAISMLDIDHFKKLNDTYGHLFGDKVLQAVAQVAKNNTPKDCFCCRFGGEEFAIIMPEKKLEEAQRIVSEVHRSLPLLRFEDDPNLRTSASFGLCYVNFASPEAQEIENFSALLKFADDELYRAKLNGRNRVETKIIDI